MNKVLTEKYELNEKDANDLADFLLPILDLVPEKRPSAAQCLRHPWMNAGPRLLEPSMPCIKDQAESSVTCVKKKREKDEKEELEIGIANISIGTAEDPQSSARR